MNPSLPLQQKERIFVLDALRGVALCGILILNMPFFSRAFQVDFDFRILNDASTPLDVSSWMTTLFVLGGSFRGMFSMLFGAGALLIISRLEKQSGIEAADIYYRRLIWLLVFGLVNAYVLLWPGDILYHYAICGLFLFPLRKSSVRVLVLLLVFFISINMFKSYLKFTDNIAKRDNGLAALALKEQKKTLTEEQDGDLKKWEETLDKQKVENIRKDVEKENKAMLQSYPKVWKHLSPLNAKFESSKFYQSIFFDVMVCVLLGMILYRTGILTGDKSTLFYFWLMLVGYGVGIGEGVLVGIAWYNAGLDFYKFIELWPVHVSLYDIHRASVSLGHIGLIMLLYKSGFFHGFLKLYANVGQMAFTNYLSQSMICTLIFYGYGFGKFGQIGRSEQWYYIIAIWVFQIIFSNVWLRYFLFGPLEWVWRSLTYWKKQPMLRSKAMELVLT
ncbi:DUF418 domain-containing protein [Chryseolinea lacunae]|uniref:DUF418 domain-containing protein n=1 Tax=Chryseolinea lacunae TaxID=2801331 RepID=A0ABS1L034_9BACT|nr:DUF418 domain-containing protein [Chryseolinea lacunae]MBL0745064.1 DUF418 domain-containing protein [Chryseolinea lacunae]